MDTTQPFKILFLCTGNSARSILAEYLIKRIGGGRFESHSAGTIPTGEVNPHVLRVLRELYQIDPAGAHSKSWEVFKQQGIIFDFVVTVCDQARENCPVWPGQPIAVHWSSPDPATFQGTEEEIHRQFANLALQIQRRIDLLCSLPFEKLDRLRAEDLTRNIGEQEKTPVGKPTILILCTGNSCRSHMAEGILRAAAGDLLNVQSAGSVPAGYVHPKAIQVLGEIGIDISAHRSKHLGEFLDRNIDTVITVCGKADQVCPMFPGQMHRHHWGFDDPAHATGTEEEILAEFRRVRDEIQLVFNAYAAGLRRGKTL